MRWWYLVQFFTFDFCLYCICFRIVAGKKAAASLKCSPATRMQVTIAPKPRRQHMAPTTAHIELQTRCCTRTMMISKVCATVTETSPAWRLTTVEPLTPSSQWMTRDMTRHPTQTNSRLTRSMLELMVVRIRIR